MRSGLKHRKALGGISALVVLAIAVALFAVAHSPASEAPQEKAANTAGATPASNIVADPRASQPQAQVSEDAEYDPSTVLVQLENDASPTALTQAFSQVAGLVNPIITTQDVEDGFVALEVSSSGDVPQLVSELSGIDGVAYSQPNYLYHIMEDIPPASNGFEDAEATSELATSSPATPPSTASGDRSNASTSLSTLTAGSLEANSADTLEALGNVNDPTAQKGALSAFNWHLKSVNAYDAWDTITGDSLERPDRVTVAIIDTGYDVDHEDLVEVTESGVRSNIIASYDATNSVLEHFNSGVGDILGHGTHVAGIVAAIADNGKGTAGVSHNANILPIQVFHTVKKDDGTTDTVASSISLRTAYEYIITNAETYNIKVANMSLGSTMQSVFVYDRPLINLIEQAYSNGILTVTAAGNDRVEQNGPYYNFPCDVMAHGMGVIALNSDLKPGSYTNYNVDRLAKTKDISAPGTAIYSTTDPDFQGGFKYDTKSGTSMATPIVSAVAALVFTVNPSLTPSDVMDIIHNTATDLTPDNSSADTSVGFDQVTGWGEVNANAAVKRAALYLRGDSSVLVGGTIEQTPPAIDGESDGSNGDGEGESGGSGDPDASSSSDDGSGDPDGSNGGDGDGADSTSNNAWTWSSSNESIATVSQDGKVTGVSGGVAEISATHDEITIRKTITVYDISFAIKGAEPSSEGFVDVGSTLELDFHENPSTGLWYIGSTDSSIASVTVDENGVTVTGNAAGEAYITAIEHDNTKLVVPFKVTVAEPVVSLTDAEVSATGWTWDAEAHDPAVTVTLDGEEIPQDDNWTYRIERDGTEYEPSEVLSEVLDAGTYTVTVTGRDRYEGNAYASFTIAPTPLTAITLEQYSYTYDGNAKRPSASISWAGGAVPIGGYSLGYDDNVEPGTATVIAAGLGNFTGTVSDTFTIVAPESEPEPEPDPGSDPGADPSPEPEPEPGADPSPEPEPEPEPSPEPAPSPAPVRTITKTYIGSANVTVASQVYTGSPLTPEPTVTLYGRTLGKQDYRVSYSNNTDAGTATVTITGSGSYSGTATGTFTIEPAPITGISLASRQFTYDGTGKRPDVTLSWSGGIVPPDGYTLTYSNNVNVGTATVTAAGLGNFTGSLSSSFTIKERTCSVKYHAYVQKKGNQAWKTGPAAAGSTGKALRLESLWVKLGTTPRYSGSIKYRTLVQDAGWKNWKGNGAKSGPGKGKRVEALQVKLSGEMARHYDVYYRVHCQDVGWLGWAKNGEKAGTAGLAKQLEAVKIKLVPKGWKAPSLNTQAYISK